MTVITNVETPGELEEIRCLFREYENFLGVDLCFQGFEEELKTLPGNYAPPKGRLLLAQDYRDVMGCVALRELEASTCEMKRLYVRSNYRGKKLGRKLAEKIIEEARQIGYSRMRLDSLQCLNEALALYKSLGFKEVHSYYHNPLPDVVYMELELNE